MFNQSVFRAANAKRDLTIFKTTRKMCQHKVLLEYN